MASIITSLLRLFAFSEGPRVWRSLLPLPFGAALPPAAGLLIVKLLCFFLYQFRLSIEVKFINKKRITTVILTFTTLLACSFQPKLAAHASTMRQSKAKPFVEVKQPQWCEDELHAIAKTLAGECYDDKEFDKRRVCEVILNRVSNSDFSDTVLGVLTAPAAFNGYWRQSRPISENDYAVAEQALRDWHDNGREPLSEWLFFNAGPNRENVFRSKF